MKTDYPYIRAWGRRFGSHQNYIDEQVELARRSNAPQDATYWNADERRWSTMAETRERAEAGNPTARQTVEVIDRIVQERFQ